jgi:hypothetical protein
MDALFVVREKRGGEFFLLSSGEMRVVWDRVRPFVQEPLEVLESPNPLVNLEQIAGKQVDWMGKTPRFPGSPPEAYAPSSIVSEAT